MYNALNAVNRNYLSMPGYKRGYQVDSGSYGGGMPSMNYGQPYGMGQYLGEPMFGGDQMLGGYPQMGYMGRTRRPNMPYGHRMGVFRPYMEQTQPFAGL